MADLGGDEVQERPGGDRFGAGQVPDLADGSLVGAEGGQASNDVGHVAVGVGKVGVADEVGPLTGHGVAENPCPQGGLGDSRAKEVRCAADGDADASGLGGGEELCRHRRPGPALFVVAASGRSSVMGLPPVGP